MDKEKTCKTLIHSSKLSTISCLLMHTFDCNLKPIYAVKVKNVGWYHYLLHFAQIIITMRGCDRLSLFLVMGRKIR